RWVGGCKALPATPSGCKSRCPVRRDGTFDDYLNGRRLAAKPVRFRHTGQAQGSGRGSMPSQHYERMVDRVLVLVEIEVLARPADILLEPLQAFGDAPGVVGQAML